MILVLDNYDSFTWNLVQYLQGLGAHTEVFRNDAVSLADIALKQPSHIVISPGPCTPDEAGISMDVIRAFGPSTPILGVCLGHQAIGQVYGGNVVGAQHIMHGKTSSITHDGTGVFKGLPSRFTATRYHSLVVAPETLPAELRVNAWTEEGDARVIMGMQHRTYPVHGVQFHPEAILTEHGHALLRNFLDTGA